MRRLLSILVVAGLIAAGIAWIADRQGELQFLIDGYEVRMSAGVAISLFIAIAAAIAFLTRMVALILSGPGAIGSWWRGRQTRRGNEALSRGLVAAAAGDAAEARRHAGKVGSLLGSPPLALLLTAQAAQLDGNDNAQGDAYRAMLAHPETEFLGLRGLFMQAMRAGDSDEAARFAARAHVLKPRAAWATNALFDLKSASGAWAEARSVLDDAAKNKMIDPDVASRRRAVLLTAEAMELDRSGESEPALAMAQEALDLAPGLEPAAALAARKFAATGRAWRAQDVIEAAWPQSPHPDLAAIYAAIRPLESEAERARRMKGLAHLNRDHFESRILEAEQAANLEQWSEARRVLAPLAGGFASARVCALMAEIEQSEKHDAAAAHAWLSQAVRAPRDADWRCENCSWSSADWHAVCAHCGAFDSLTWTTPMVGVLATLPGAPHDARLAADAAHAFLTAREDEQYPAARPRLEPRKIKTSLEQAERGFVEMPRPPDDPGPGGDDIFEAETFANNGGF
ncbi:MAG TPA: heme biosynthesis HemY N-terminal domain-containing protein [Rhizomicrobium sp.]